MRIGIDAHYVGVRHSGNEQYFEGLIRALLRHQAPEHGYFVFSYRAAAAPLLPGAQATHIPFARRSVWWQRGVELPWQARRLQLDVLHVPFNFLPLGRHRTVVTIHDLGFVRLPAAYAPLERLRMRALTRVAAGHADHILTCSEYTKREIVEHYGLPESRITVAAAAVDRDVFRPVASAGRSAEPYVLFVGVIQERKNLEVLLHAIERLRLRLVLVGRLGFGAERVFARIRERRLEPLVQYLGVVSRADLVGLYNRALAFVFPSLLEGFGMPVLEAMACGCPVVSSTAGSLPEVCGSAALLFDPHSAEELTAQLGRVRDDTALRADLVRRGLANCDRFSWDRTAAVVETVYSAR